MTGASRVRAFGFPSPPPPPPPGRTLARIARLQGASAFLAAALAASVLCNAGLGAWVLGRADARAYATDGSLYGCELREHDGPPPGAEEGG